MNREQLASYQPLHVFDEAIFENIVDDLVTKGFSIQEHGLPDFITQALLACQRSISEAEYQAAGIGRAENYQKAKKSIDKSAKLFPSNTSESMIGSFRNIVTASIDIEKENYKKVLKSVSMIEKLSKDYGFTFLDSRKDKILAQLCEKKKDYKNALEHYKASITSAPT